MSSKKPFNKEQTWSNIKDLGIFDDYEEFIETSKKYDGCFVWRKYSAYPWVKENVFLGSWNDLLNWYETNTEVPFFYNKHIGKQYKLLTIEGFEIKIVNKKRTVFAKCLCKCGNHCIKNYKTLLKGNVGSCGCRGKKIESLYDIHPKIVEQYWDYEKNKKSPKDIPFNSVDKCYWKGYGDIFLMSPTELLSKSNRATSFPEQTILFFLKKYFKSVDSRVKIENNQKKYELDIYIPEFKIGIEYDGERWHKDKFEKEIEKNNAAIANGIYLIRVRESGLKNIKFKNIDTIICDIENYAYYEAIANCINEIFDLFHKRFKIKGFIDITKDDIVQNKIQIMSQYMTGFECDNIKVSWLNKFWSDTNSIESYKISQNSPDRFDFKCYNDEIINIPPYIINNIVKNIDIEQQKAFKEKLVYKNFQEENYCPFVGLPYCPCNRIYHDKECKSCQIFNRSKNDTIYSIPFQEAEKNFLASYKKVAKDINSSTNKYYFRTALINLLMYKIGNRDKVINKFCKSDLISNHEKVTLINNCIFWPEFEYITTKRLFENSSLLRLYFSNYDYSKISFLGENILDLFHKHIVYDILKSFVLMKDFDLLEKALSIIKLNVESELFINIIYALVLQIVLKSGEKFEKLFNRKQGFVSFYNLLSDLFENQIPAHIKNIFEEYMGKNNILDIQYKMQCSYFGDLIDKLILNNSLNSENLLKIALKFKTISLKFTTTTQFAQFIKLKILNQYKKNVPKDLIKNINLLTSIQNSFNDYLDKFNSMIPHKNWIIDMTDIKDIKLLKNLVQQGLLFKFDYEFVIQKKEYDIIEKFIQLINQQEVWVSDFIDDKDNLAQLLKKTKKQNLVSFAEDISTNYILGRKK